MTHFLRVSLFSMFVAISVTACRQAQDESAEAARETITEMKTNTIDAAKKVAADAERVAGDIAKAAESARPVAEDE